MMTTIGKASSKGFERSPGERPRCPPPPARPATKAGRTRFQMGIRKVIEKGCLRKGITPPDF